MTMTNGQVCGFCGAPIREVVNGACPFCKTLLPAAVVETAHTAPSGLADVVLVDAGAKVINVIKVIREHTGLGLKVRTSPDHPSVIGAGRPLATAAQWVADLAAVGA
jgi:ribosomal protein L7/L12